MPKSTLEEVQGEEVHRKVDKRKLLTLATIAAAGLTVKPFMEKAYAQTGNPLYIGEENTAEPTQITMLKTNVDGGSPPHLVAGLVVQNESKTNWPIAISGHCDVGIGVLGSSCDGHGVLARSIYDVAMKAHSNHGVGVVGFSEDGLGVHASSLNGIALKVEGKSRCHATVNDWQPDAPYGLPSAFSVINNADKLIEKPPVAIVGYAPKGVGVAGFSDSDTWAVHGNSTDGAGLDGYSDNGVGVQARCGANGTALKVYGKSIMEANVEWPQIALEVHNNAKPIEGEGWVSPISIVGICPKGVGIVGSGSEIGVHGKTDGDGTGVNGGSDSGTGVAGESNSGIGVRASSKTGFALQVEGKSNFNGKIGEPLIVGQDNSGYDKATGLTAKIDSGVTLYVGNEGEPQAGQFPPVAIQATSKNGNAIDAVCDQNTATGVAVGARSGFVGVGAIGGRTGVGGISSKIGVYGVAIKDAAELGEVWPPPDLDSPVGMYGYSKTGTAIRAASESGTALMVDGKSTIVANVDNTVALNVSNNSENNGGAINAYSKSAAAMMSVSESNIGIIGVSNAKSAPGLDSESGLPGIEGFSKFSFGVLGLSDMPSTYFINWYTDPNRGKGGLLGYASDGKGVVGFSDNGIGVLAVSKGSPALRVEGKSSFSTVGNGTFPRMKKSFTVEVSGLVTEKSHISVTLTSDPGSDTSISWIERDPPDRFTINLTKSVLRATSFTYFIVEP